MPRFLDVHNKTDEISPEVIGEIKGRMQMSQADEQGCIAIDMLMAGNGKAFCLTDGPSAEAVIESHKAAGIEIHEGDVYRVTSLAAS
jgi:hypothetical protein